jgi:2-keto-4-pentenoate hydratase
MELSEMLIKAYESNREMPLVSARVPELDVETAYAIQKAYVGQRLVKDRIVGFKAGATSEAVQKRFGLQAPAAAVLMASGMKKGSPVIEISQFKRLVIETEVGFSMARAVPRPINDVSQLREFVREVMPAIELPDLGFEDMENLKGVDIIASNVATAQFIAGKGMSFESLALSSLSVTLTLNGELVNEGKGADAMGDPWNALLWTVNKTLEQGWNIEPGHVFITGALGQVVPGKRGKYMADFGKLGKISFEVR